MAHEGYARTLFGQRGLGDLNLVVIQGTIAGSSGAVTIDATVSSPGTTITRDSAGQYSVTFSPGQYFIPLEACTVLAEQLGSAGFLEAFSATSGTASYEFGTTAGTNADPADLTRICIAFLVGRN